MVTGGSSMLRVWQLYGNNEATPFGLSAWILVFFGLQLFLSQVSGGLVQRQTGSWPHPVQSDRG